MSLSCSSKPADLRTLIPADSLVYLESSDLGAVMKAITERPAFREAAKSVPDFSVLDGVKLAVAVTGFETKEQPVTDENSVLSFQPRFVAVLDTNAWNFQALSFTENKLGEFINQIYGGEVTLETSDKHDGKYFVWTANDGRKAYALVQGSIVYFGNDETAIERSLAVKRGEADSIAKNPKITNGDRLAFGYVSSDGVAQLANVLGVKYASDASDEPEVQSAVAGILPQLLRNTITDVTWIATKTDEGVEDKWQVMMPPEVANIFQETIVPSEASEATVEQFISGSAASLTRYNLRDPRLAWRSVLLVAQKQTDPISSGIIAEVARLAAEAFGIVDPELFLASIKPRFITVRVDAEGEESAIIAGVSDYDNLKNAVSKQIDFSKMSSSVEAEEFHQTGDGDLAFARQKGSIIVGSPAGVQSGIRAGYSELFGKTAYARMLKGSWPVTTVGSDRTTAVKLIDILTREGEVDVVSTYLTETRFNKPGMERRTVSDFGFIGWILTQFAKE